jgi:mannonate dehydratase
MPADPLANPFFEQTWRWFGPSDPVTLADVRQAGATGVVTALHHVPCGDVWTVDEIERRKREVEAAGLRWSVVESVAVHEDIKQGVGDYARYLDNYCRSLEHLGRCGINVVCYNFMAVTDWTRTDTAMRLPSGALALRFDATDAAVFDLFIVKRRDAAYPDELRAAAEARFASMSNADRDRLSRTILLGLPGTVKDLTVAEFCDRLAAYEAIDSDALRANHTAFLKHVIPSAEAASVVLAIHPDDPPFPMFGLPRIASTEADLQAIVDSVDSPANGITYCTGSLGARAGNDLPGILRRLGDRIHFLHLRAVRREPDGSFFEDDHLAGSSDVVAIVREVIALMKRRGTSLPMRPDHGHQMLNDLRDTRHYAGYSAIGRLKGLAELRGLELGLRASLEGVTP